MRHAALTYLVVQSGVKCQLEADVLGLRLCAGHLGVVGGRRSFNADSMISLILMC